MEKINKKPMVRVADIDREMTDEEYQVYLRDQKYFEEKTKIEKEAQAKRESAIKKLIDLGLTEEEVKAFLG